MAELRPYQSETINQLYASLASRHRAPLAQLPTGAGKTIIAAQIVLRARGKGKRVTFVVPAIELIDQTVAKLVSHGIPMSDIAVMQADHPLTNPGRPVQVASVQTLARRALPQTDLVIVDEAHVRYEIITKWMAEQTKLPFIGLTATPWSRGLGQSYDDLIKPVTMRELIEAGHLSDFRVFAPTHPDLTGVKTVAGDYHEGQLGAAMDKPKITADVVSTWLKLGENRPTLCFAVNRAHAASIHVEFEKAGVSSAYLDGETPPDERKVIRDGFHAGRFKVVCNVGVLTIGADWDVRCLILARPTKSEILYVQIIGRALRTAPGKADALILDHSDTTLRLGFVDQIGRDALDDGSKRGANAADGDDEEEIERAKATPKECQNCHYVKPAGVHKCPHCGFVPLRISDVEVRQGELAQLGGKAAVAERSVKQAFWSGLMWYRANEGRSESWAKANYRQRFGVWPKGLSDVAKAPDIECRNFIAACKREWIAKKRAEAAAAQSSIMGAANG